MNSHVCIFPTWKCQLACSYCSIRNSKIDRSTPSVDWRQWATALPRVLPPGSIVDVAGGEPLLYWNLLSLLDALAKAGLRWGLTTNAKCREAITRLALYRIPGCAQINVSDHAGNPEVGRMIRLLRTAGYPVNVHRVDHPAAGQHEPDAITIPYQDWSGGRATDGVKRHCTAGLKHWVADPKGDLWRCVVALETGQPSAGNLFTGEVKPTGAECDFGCTTCYTEDPASWGIEMTVLAERTKVGA